MQCLPTASVEAEAAAEAAAFWALRSSFSVLLLSVMRAAVVGISRASRDRAAYSASSAFRAFTSSSRVLILI